MQLGIQSFVIWQKEGTKQVRGTLYFSKSLRHISVSVTLLISLAEYVFFFISVRVLKEQTTPRASWILKDFFPSLGQRTSGQEWEKKKKIPFCIQIQEAS